MPLRRATPSASRWCAGAILQPVVALEDVEERQVAVLVGLLEDAVEVADRLMIVQDEAQADRAMVVGRKVGSGLTLRYAFNNRQSRRELSSFSESVTLAERDLVRYSTPILRCEVRARQAEPDYALRSSSAACSGDTGLM